MVEKRGIIAHFTIKDDYNSNKGTLDQFLDEIGQGGNRKDDSKVVCVDAFVDDGVSDDCQWARYISYLCHWAMDHVGEEYDGMSPACYDEWKGCEDSEED